MGIVVCTGYYAEVKKSEIVWDGDYLRGELVVRVVANSFDNAVVEHFPDEVGMFCKGILDMGDVGIMQADMKEALKEGYGFDDETLNNLVVDFKYE